MNKAEKAEQAWPKARYSWTEDDTLYISIPFTWELPGARNELKSPGLFWEKAVVGGPAVRLLPGFFKDMPWVEEGVEMPGVLQRINPLATRTTTGCPRKCKFCGVGMGLIENEWRELEEYPDLPVLCDNNILAASDAHLEKVVGRLRKWGWADFNQGVDARLITEGHAELLASIGRPTIRLAYDHPAMSDAWVTAFERLRKAGIQKSLIRTYVLIGHDSGPEEAWKRCKFIESHNTKALPMWFHRLDALKKNKVTPEQAALGWTDYDRRKIMQWHYWHKEAVCHTSTSE